MDQKDGRREMTNKEVVKAHVFRNTLFAGLAVLVPLVITLLVLKFVIGLTQQVFVLLPILDPNRLIGGKLGALSRPFFGIILTFALVMVFGAIARNYIGKKLVGLGERVIDKLPLIRSIYQASKQLVETLLSQSQKNFRNAVLIEYPKEGIYSLAFITGEAKGELGNAIGKECYNVFVPTTPNPTSGFFLMVPKEDVIAPDIDVEEAFRAIISAGVASSKDIDEKV